MLVEFLESYQVIELGEIAASTGTGGLSNFSFLAWNSLKGAKKSYELFKNSRSFIEHFDHLRKCCKKNSPHMPRTLFEWIRNPELLTMIQRACRITAIVFTVGICALGFNSPGLNVVFLCIGVSGNFVGIYKHYCAKSAKQDLAAPAKAKGAPPQTKTESGGAEQAHAVIKNPETSLNEPEIVRGLTEDTSAECTQISRKEKTEAWTEIGEIVQPVACSPLSDPNDASCLKTALTVY